ncbi:helix-turn-helix transcriptional regulator [Sphingomonas sp. Root720]|uniref:helix-turn-helix transcriptional regulator n=1 Tax=Sphingomonas sp. Root720 TaxID=1736595 RepID=UPI000714C545|nr:LuxR C-terminal-related transcriptional regulator [Sphingomonas sp. Root720]KRB93687.1 hypothetical protein ASE22_25115 [Sphingomonas sp. Root720]
MIRAKLIPPVGSGTLVRRERLLRAIENVRTARLTLVQAAAGYGKTSLLAEWSRLLSAEGGVTAWLGLDAGDQGPLDLFSSILRSLELSGVRIESVAELLTAEGFATTRALAAATSDLLTSVDAPIYLFLDDAHFLTTSVSHAALNELLHVLPAHAHLIVGSRRALPIQLGRMRVREELFEVYADDLKFSRPEIEEFFTVTGQTELSAEQIEDIGSRTEGWAAGLRLVSLALRDGTHQYRLGADIGERRRSIGSYFAEEVLVQQTPELQDFLMRTAPLERITPALVDAVTGTENGKRMIRKVESLGLFIYSLDNNDEWYRYHHLFSDFLLQRLIDRDPAAPAEIAIRASDWFAERGHLIEAFAYAVRACDHERAAAILDRRCQSMFYNGELGSIETLATQVPMKALGRFPRVLLTKAWLSIIGWHFTDADELLHSARQRLLQLGASPEAEIAPDLDELNFLLVHREMMLGLFTDRLSETEALWRKLSEMPKPSDHYILGTLFTSRIYIDTHRLLKSDVASGAARGREHYARTGSIFVLIWHASVIGISLFRQGSTDHAEAAFDEALKCAIRLNGADSAQAAIPSLLLSELLYETGEVQRAASIVAQYREVGREMGYVDQLVAEFSVSTRLRLLRGETAMAERAFADAIAFAASSGFERLRLAVAAETARLHLHSGRPDIVGRYTREGDISLCLDHHMPSVGMTTIDELKAIIAVRKAQATGKIAEAGRVARRWRDHNHASGWILSAVRWGIMAGGCDALRGDRNQAYRTLLKAVDLAREPRFLRSFLDEGEIVMSVLREFNSENSHNGAFIATLTRLHDEETGNLSSRAPISDASLSEQDYTHMVEVLNTREIDILRSVGNGRMNREIAGTLGLTEGSVKWYLNRIYGKIGVSRRAQAVKRARQLGLIN